MTIKPKVLTETASFIVKNPEAGQIIGIMVGSIGLCGLVSGYGIYVVSRNIILRKT